ncbi:MAG: Ig-like domain-containing protein [Actinomycetota bacterium]
MKRFLRATVITLVVLMALSAGAVPAFAASPSATSLRTSTSYATPNIDIPVFGIDLIASGSCTTFTDLVVDFLQVAGGGTFDADDLESNGADAGISLWRDTGTTADQLDADDAEVPSSFTISPIDGGFEAALDITPDAMLPVAEEGSYTYFLTIRLSSLVTNGDDVQVRLPSNALRTGGSILCLSDPTITEVTTGTIIADTVAPTVTLFTPASSQTANVSWLLNEPIVGVDEGAASDNVVLREAGTTDDLPAHVAYNDATKTITLDPDGALIAGQKYNAILLPNGAGSITDRAGNELQPKTNLFRAATNVNEVASGVRYSWRNLANSSTYGGSYVVNNTPGATIAYTFVGSSIAWYTIRDPYQGVAAVSIDGRSFGTVNNYSSTARYKVGKSFSGLAAGTHTITIRVTGSKGSSSGKDVRVSIDAFRSGGSTNVTPSLSYRWAAVSASGADGGTYRVARFSGTEMTFVFSGTSIAWRTVRGPAMGQAYVYIDGALKGLIDNYSSTTTYKVMRAFLNLTDGTHTIRIRVASTRNSRATDRNIAVDGFVIG